jgi:hypothetical protein
MKALKTIAAFVPGPCLVFVGQWINLLSSTVLANPTWQVSADKLALALATILTFFIIIGTVEVRKEILKRLFFVGSGAVVLGIAICWGVWLHLGPPSLGSTAPDPTAWQMVWETAYILTQGFLVATISIGALSINEDKPWLFWLLSVVALVSAIVVLYFMFWHIVESYLANSRAGLRIEVLRQWTMHPRDIWHSAEVLT